ncbi:hypothetical protein [Burkholderia metallica]|nr:hypothetical protein [Burkholderia metallica]
MEGDWGRTSIWLGALTTESAESAESVAARQHDEKLSMSLNSH